MASVTNALRSGVFGEDYVKLADKVALALSGLPGPGRRDAMRRLAEVLADKQASGDGSAVHHFVESLEMTARMTRSRDYRIAMARVEAAGDPRDINDVIAMLEAGADESGTNAA
ncbi:hypothetical protein [Actinokineospora sp. HUAS TT18]|uniref:hypothetical protein n=1 Tax=Actinokineospora sp. HUAS TT18 TaxID=3447451 RepID=UPI003F5280ED